jgi:hydroxyethylthiazole kinase
VAANHDRSPEATAAAVATMGLAGEIAYERLSEKEGNASYSNYTIDAIYNMTPGDLEKGAKYEVR